MHRQALLASLPMTLSPAFHGDLRKMKPGHPQDDGQRHPPRTGPGRVAGSKTPTLMFAGRRGQLLTLDLYDNDGNYNAAVIGSPGSGKSVLLNELAWSYRAIGAKIWMQDLGRSFEKLCRKAEGTFIEFRPTSRSR